MDVHERAEDWAFRILIGAVAVLLILFLTGLDKKVAAEPLTGHQAMSIYVMAGGLSGLPMPERAPTIVLAKQAKLQELACGGRPCPAVRGVTMPDGRIWLDESLDFSDPEDASILLHEMVHYLQWARSGPIRSCDEWRRREVHAYTVQMEELHHVGVVHERGLDEVLSWLERQPC